MAHDSRDVLVRCEVWSPKIPDELFDVAAKAEEGCRGSPNAAVVEVCF